MMLANMDDAPLKPRMLRSLLRDYLPDEKRPFPSSSELSSVLSHVKIHGLLSERNSNGATNPKQMKEWESAVDEWVDRLISLISSTMPDKCWAGICLLGVTCEGCKSDRFLASYSLWFQKLLACIQLSSSTLFVKVASCASLADLFIRLGSYSNVKKDATSLTGKLIQPILQLLNEDGSEVLWEGALNLLWTIMTLFPYSVHRHYDNVEASLVSRIMLAKSNSNMSKKLACCLALLPKVKSDEDSWSLLMQKILISIHVLLADAFQGLEEEAKSSEIMRLLVPPGKDPPLPLGGQSISEGTEEATKKLQEVLRPRISALMYCCCMMLTSAYPFQVTVPIHHLLALVERVILVDGSLNSSLLPFTTLLQQELLCAELPTLHLASLDLLIAVIKGVRSQLLPHAANIARLVAEYFRRATLPSIRIKIYYIMQILLISMGVGMAQYLGNAVINSAYADLNGCSVAGPVSSCMHLPKAPSEALQQSQHKKRKLASASPIEQPKEVKFGKEALSKRMPPLSVKVAALKALESLLTVGGSLRTNEDWRPNVDSLLINVATNACELGWGREGKCLNLTEESPVSQADFQLAALQALLASLLSEAYRRPPYLSQAFDLFHRGKQEIGTKLAEFCAHALLAMEILIHPRSLPLRDAAVARSSESDGEGFIIRHEQPPCTISTFSKDQGINSSNMGNVLLDNDDEPAMDNTNTTTKHVEQFSSFTVVDDVVEENLVDEQLRRTHEIIEKTLVADIEMATCSVEEEANAANHSGPSLGNVTEHTGVRLTGSGSARSPGLDDISINLGLDGLQRDEMMEGCNNVVILEEPDFGSSYGNSAVSAKDMLLSHDSDSESIDSLPPIVEAPPDSDSE